MQNISFFTVQNGLLGEVASIQDRFFELFFAIEFNDAHEIFDLCCLALRCFAVCIALCRVAEPRVA